MEKIELKRGQKVKCVGSAFVRYMYGLEDLTTGKIYEVITGFGEKAKDLALAEASVTLGHDQFEIVDDEGCACWSTLTSLEREAIFKVVE